MRKDARDEASKLERLAQVLSQLRLQPAYAHLEQLLAVPQDQSRSDWLLSWLEPEAIRRREQRAEYRFRRSKLPERKTLDAFDFDFQPNLSRDQVMDLATLAPHHAQAPERISASSSRSRHGKHARTSSRSPVATDRGRLPRVTQWESRPG